MPIYEYKCPNNHHFEVFHGMTEASPETCELCEASPLQRVLFPVAVHYKGSGFYSTDYGKGNAKKAGTKEGGSSGEGSSSGSSESGGSGDGGGKTGSGDGGGKSAGSDSGSGSSSGGDSKSGGSSSGSSSSSDS